MAKRTAKKSGKKKAQTAKKAGAKRGRVAGREVDLTPVEFETASVDDFNFGGRIRETSKYKGLVDAAVDLEDGQCVTVDVLDDDPDKKRLNIAQVIYNKAKPNLENGYKFRIRLNGDKTKVVVSCHAVEVDEEE